MTTLVLAPHADDEVLGCGGTISRLCKNGDQVVVAVLTGPGSDNHPIWPSSAWDTVRAECRNACERMGVKDVRFFDLPAACLDYHPTYETNKVVAEVIEAVQPDHLYLPFAHDLHTDHGTVAYAAAVATRPYLAVGRQLKRVLAYETMSETHLATPYVEPAFQPNYFCDISSHLQAKLDAMSCYESQIQSGNQPRSLRALTALAQLRGTHIGVEAAEAFVLIREVW